jgi:hypothetical protein
MREPATEDWPLDNPPYRGGILNGFDLNDRSRCILVVAMRSGEGPFTHPLQTSIIMQHKRVAC